MDEAVEKRVASMLEAIRELHLKGGYVKINGQWVSAEDACADVR